MQQEPTLDEMLADPIVRALMKSDCVEEADIRSLLCRVRHKCGTCARSFFAADALSIPASRTASETSLSFVTTDKMD